MKGWAYRIHILLGPAAAVPLLLITLTGLALGLVRLQKWPGHEPRPADTRVFLPAGQTLTFDRSGHEKPIVTPPATNDPIKFLYHLHRGKTAGLPGQILASAAGVAAFSLWLIGLFAKRGAPHRQNKARWFTRASWRHQHRRAGPLAGALMAAVMLLGAVLNFAPQLINKFDPPPSAQSCPAAQIPTAPKLHELTQAALAAYPGTALESIHFSAETAKPVLFYFEDSSRVYLDPCTTAVLKTSAWNSHWSRAVFALHTGRWLGRWQPLWVAATAAAALVLLLSGIMLTFQRARGRVLLEATYGDEKTQMRPVPSR